MDENELCEMLSADLDIEAKYFAMVPYKSDDSDFDWHKRQSSNSTDSEEREEFRIKGIMNHSKTDNNNDSSSADEYATPTPGKVRKYKHKKKKGHGRTVKPSLKFEEEAGHSKWLENLTQDQHFDVPEFKSPLGRQSQVKEPLQNDPTEDPLQMLRQHRKVISMGSCCNSNDSSPLKVLNTSYPLNIYPGKWEPASPVPNLNRTYPLSEVSCTTSSDRTEIYSQPFIRRRTPQKRTRWSGNCSSTDSSSLDHSSTLTEAVPHYQNYQLLGDSQLLRFSEQLLNFRRFISYSAGIKRRRLGYCVSGQKIEDLRQRLENKECKLSDKVIMLIGTNDMVYGTQLGQMCDSFDSILKILMNNSVTTIVLLTIPPVPRICTKPEHWRKLQRFNDFIVSRAEKERIIAIDLASFFISYNNTVKTLYFEQNFGDSSKVDLIHLNRDGFEVLKFALDLLYFNKVNSTLLRQN